jgi:integrase
MVYFRELQAAGRSAATLRSYGMDLLRWFRFLWAADVEWDQATRVEAREFSRRLQLLDKPDGRSMSKTQREPNPITGKVRPGPKYAPTTRAHSETVLRGFYDCHLDLGSGPLVNPFPKVRAQRANAHHNPMEPYRRQRVGLFRPRVPQRVPRSIPDERYNELFAALSCNRDRALVAFYVSTAARASELLGAAVRSRSRSASDLRRP